MEELQKAVRSAMGQDSKLPSKISSSLDLNNKPSFNSAASAPALSSEQSRLLLTRPPRFNSLSLSPLFNALLNCS